MKLIKVNKIKEKPAIKAEFELNDEYLAVIIERQWKNKYQIEFVNRQGKKSVIDAGNWQDPPIRKIKRKIELLGFKLRENDIEKLFFKIINHKNSNWLEEWTAPQEEQRNEEKELEQKARELLKDPLLLQKIRTVLDFKIAGMGKKKLATFLCLLSKNLKNPKERISTCIYGKWGEGKSFLSENVLDLFDFIRMNSATLASIYRDSLKDVYCYDGKILYLGDLSGEIPESLKEVFEVLKQLVSEGEVVRKIVMDDDTVELKLRGYPILVWTAQATPDDDQILSRVLPIQPELSEKQRRIVQIYANYEKELPKEIFYPGEVEELEKVVKKALKILEKEALPVINPYARLINTCMSIHSPNINRDRNKFFGIVSALTHLYQYQRAKINVNGQEYVVVHPIDILNALYIVGEEFEVLFGGLDQLSQTALEIIKEKVEPISCSLKDLQRRMSNFEEPELRKESSIELKTKAFTNTELAEWMNIHQKTASRITKKLFEKGLLDRIKEGRSWKYYLLPEYEQSSKTNGVILFDSRRMLEGLIGEKELREWLDRYGFSMSPERVGEYILRVEDLEHILTPEARVFEITYIPLWDTSEIMLFKPPFSFNFLIEKYDFLRERRRMLDNRSKKEVIEEEDKKEEPENVKEWLEKYVEIAKEDNITWYSCKKCKFRVMYEKDIIDHLKVCSNILPKKDEEEDELILQLRSQTGLEKAFLGGGNED